MSQRAGRGPEGAYLRFVRRIYNSLYVRVLILLVIDGRYYHYMYNGTQQFI